MEKFESPESETPLTTPNDISHDDTFEPVGVPDGQPLPSSPTGGHSSTTVAVKVGQSDIPVESETTLDLRNRMRTPEHVLGTQAVSELFVAAQFPRSQRSIERYCNSGKLDAYFDSTTKQYLITRKSVQRVIDDLKQAELHRNPLSKTEGTISDSLGRQPPSVSLTDGQVKSTASDVVGHGTPTESATVGETEIDQKDLEIKELRTAIGDKDRQIRNLEIADQVKDSLLERTKEQFTGFLDRLTHTSRRVGELENENRRLRELPSGTNSTGNDSDEDSSSAY
jgi:hypothetical protein